MPYCPRCGNKVNPTDCFCGQCGKSLASEAQPSVPTNAIPAGGWTLFECGDGSFTVCHPADWRPADPPVSDGASLSCVGPGGFKLLEAFSYHREGQVPAGGPDLVAITMEGLEQTLGLEDGHANVHVCRRERIHLRGAEHAERLVVTCTDRGLETTSDYLLVGDKRREIMLALKVLSPDYAATLPLFEQVIGSLATPWLPADATSVRAKASKDDSGTESEPDRQVTPVDPRQQRERIAQLRATLQGQTPMVKQSDDEARRLLGMLGELPEGAVVNAYAAGVVTLQDAVAAVAAFARIGTPEAIVALIDSIDSKNPELATEIVNRLASIARDCDRTTILEIARSVGCRSASAALAEHRAHLRKMFKV